MVTVKLTASEPIFWRLDPRSYNKLASILSLTGNYPGKYPWQISLRLSVRSMLASGCKINFDGWRRKREPSSLHPSVCSSAAPPPWF